MKTLKVISEELQRTRPSQQPHNWQPGAPGKVFDKTAGQHQVESKAHSAATHKNRGKQKADAEAEESKHPNVM